MLHEAGHVLSELGLRDVQRIVVGLGELDDLFAKQVVYLLELHREFISLRATYLKLIWRKILKRDHNLHDLVDVLEALHE